MSDKDIAGATGYEMRYGTNANDLIQWEILADNVHVTDEDQDTIRVPKQNDVIIPDIDLETRSLIDTY